MTTLQEIEGAVRELLAELASLEWDASVPRVAGVHDEIPMARRAGLDPANAPMPLLHACRRRWALPRGWRRGYCPICGAWPGFAEVCGVERNRYLRCLRCGAGWQAHGLSCVYCGMSDHAQLGSLVPEQGPQRWAIEVCNACRGYLKSFTRLGVGVPEQAMLDDLASVELDIAARQRGFRRPEGAGYACHVAG